MALSPPRSPPWSAPATLRSSGSPNSTRHSTLTPAPASTASSPPSSSGTRPPAPATVTWRMRAPWSAARRLVHRLHRAAARRGRVIARRARGHRHRLEVGRHGRAAYFEPAPRASRPPLHSKPCVIAAHTTNVRSYLRWPGQSPAQDGPSAAAPVPAAPLRVRVASQQAAIRHAEVMRCHAQAARPDVHVSGQSSSQPPRRPWAPWRPAPRPRSRARVRGRSPSPHDRARGATASAAPRSGARRRKARPAFAVPAPSPGDRPVRVAAATRAPSAAAAPTAASTSSATRPGPEWAARATPPRRPRPSRTAARRCSTTAAARASGPCAG